MKIQHLFNLCSLGIFLAIPIAGMIAIWMRLSSEEKASALAEVRQDVIVPGDVEPSEKS